MFRPLGSGFRVWDARRARSPRVVQDRLHCTECFRRYSQARTLQSYSIAEKPLATLCECSSSSPVNSFPMRVPEMSRRNNEPAWLVSGLERIVLEQFGMHIQNHVAKSVSQCSFQNVMKERRRIFLKDRFRDSGTLYHSSLASQLASGPAAELAAE